MSKRLNKRLRKSIRENRFDPLETRYNPRIATLFKEVGHSLRNSKERNNVQVKYHGPKQIQIKTQEKAPTKKGKTRGQKVFS